MIEIDRLIVWLRHQSKYHYVLGRMHTLNLWDWEVDMLLAELEEQKKCFNQSDSPVQSGGTRTESD